MTTAADTTATTTTAPATEGSGPPAVADVTPATPSHVQDAAKQLSFAERMAKAKAVFAEAGKPKLEGAAPQETPAEAPAEEPAAEVKPKVETAADKPADPKAEAQNVRALAALRKAEAENLRLKAEAKASADKLAAELAADRAEAAKLKAQLEALAKDPSLALKHAGMTPDQYMRGVVDGKIKPPSPEDALRDQVTEKLSPVEQRLAEAEAKLKAREEAEAKAARDAETKAAQERDLGVVKSIVTAEEYPITAALGAYETVLAECYRTGSQDVAAKAAEFEAHQIGLLENLLTPKLLAALEKRSAKIRETVTGLKAGAQSRQTTGSSGGPRVAARDVVSAPSTPVEQPKTDAERMARAKARLMGAR